jgi:hypothetical protein
LALARPGQREKRWRSPRSLSEIGYEEAFLGARATRPRYHVSERGRVARTPGIELIEPIPSPFLAPILDRLLDDGAGLLHQRQDRAPGDDLADPVAILDLGGQQIDALLGLAQVELGESRAGLLQPGNDLLIEGIRDLVHKRLLKRAANIGRPVSEANARTLFAGRSLAIPSPALGD